MITIPAKGKSASAQPRPGAVGVSGDTGPPGSDCSVVCRCSCPKAVRFRLKSLRSEHVVLASWLDRDRAGGMVRAIRAGQGAWSGVLGTKLVEVEPGRLGVLPRQESSSPTGNHGTTPPYGRELPPGRTRKGEVDSDSLFRGFRWIPWLISDPSGAAIGCCWTESAVRICADLGCRGNHPNGSSV